MKSEHGSEAVILILLAFAALSRLNHQAEVKKLLEGKYGRITTGDTTTQPSTETKEASAMKHKARGQVYSADYVNKLRQESGKRRKKLKAVKERCIELGIDDPMLCSLLGLPW